MRFRTILSLVTFFLTCFTLAVFAQPLPANAEGYRTSRASENQSVSGQIASVGDAVFAISVTKNNQAQTVEFLVDDKTEFWGPKGGDRGTGPKGLKDDCMAAGYEIKVVPAKDGKTAKDVFLPVRK